MTTAYRLMLDRCGLSVREAAAFHRARRDTVASWASGRNPVPPAVIAELRALHARIELAAAAALAVLADHPADDLELGMAGDDTEAQALGWPCVGAHAALLGIVAARTAVAVRIVPRGSTLASAAAAASRVAFGVDF